MSRGSSERDRRHMATALGLAARADFATSPNPMVGCVIVRGDEIVGSGYHHGAGQAHAEVEALAAAGDAARGAEVFVSLEPCSHHGRTPPCADALVAAGTVRCVIATGDPNPAVAGAGIAGLRAAGITVEVGVLEDQARRLNEFFLTSAGQARPFVTAKFAASLDGRIATRTGASRWITSLESRRHAHRLRHAHDAVLVGVGTVLADDPTLTVRDPEGAVTAPRQPLRVILDSHLRTPPSARALDTPGALIATAPGADPARVAALTARGAEVAELAVTPRGIDIAAVFAELHGRGLISVLVEGGAGILGSVADGCLADKWVTYLAPRIIGGVAARPAVAGEGIAGLDDAGRLTDITVERRGGDLVITGYRVR